MDSYGEKKKDVFKNESVLVWTWPMKQAAVKSKRGALTSYRVKVSSVFRNSASNIDCMITHDAPGCLKFSYFKYQYTV